MTAWLLVTIFLAYVAASVVTATVVVAVVALTTDTGAGIVDDVEGE